MPVPPATLEILGGGPTEEWAGYETLGEAPKKQAEVFSQVDQLLQELGGDEDPDVQELVQTFGKFKSKWRQKQQGRVEAPEMEKSRALGEEEISRTVEEKKLQETRSRAWSDKGFSDMLRGMRRPVPTGSRPPKEAPAIDIAPLAARLEKLRKLKAIAASLTSEAKQRGDKASWNRAVDIQTRHDREAEKILESIRRVDPEKAKELEELWR